MFAPLVAFVCLAAAGVSAQDQKPLNILYIFLDDMGYADVEWKEGDIPTPNLRNLCFNKAVNLTNYYNLYSCSLTRSSLATGFDAYHLGTHTNVLGAHEPVGVPLQYPFYGEALHALGYKNYYVGKWHLGYCRKEYLPTYRGFDKFSGYYLPDGEDYFNHWLAYKDPYGKKRQGYYMTDEEDGKSQINYDANGTYSNEWFAKRMVKFITDHQQENPDKPWLGFVSFSAPHCPNQAPKEDVERCKNMPNASNNLWRRIYCAQMANADTWVGWIVDQLKSLGEYDDTVILFTADNGGKPTVGASNRPLRGGKASAWEGGVKSQACVHYAGFKDNYRDENALVHVTDWFATFLGIGGAKVSTYGDGYNQWPLLKGDTTKAPRNMMIYQITPYLAAIRWNNWKLMLGQPNALSIYGMKGEKPDVSDLLSLDVDDSDVVGNLRVECLQEDPNPWGERDKQPDFPAGTIEYLFDIDADPNEITNLASSNPQLVNRLKRILSQYMAQQAKPVTYDDKPSLRVNWKSLPLLYNNTWPTNWCQNENNNY
jgi:arylsulfatase B/arylsulfatase I/J